jgi:signal transduction histidine kinase
MWFGSKRARRLIALRQQGRERQMAKELEELKVENAALAERLMRAERLEGLGLLASGMAHALNNPLTAVLGFANLIGDTTTDGRVKEDAAIIVREALRMRETVETLLGFWRSTGQSEVPVDVVELVRELAEMCAEKLESRGVRLVVQAGDGPVAVRGNRERLQLMVEHLLNNAAQALAEGAQSGEEQAVRVSVGVDGPNVHLIVSDTGPGFCEPERVFVVGEMVRGVGLGLSVCYRTAHEHGGEIGAFNLHPHGAAVAVKLPICDFFIKPGVRAGHGSIA